MPASPARLLSAFSSLFRSHDPAVRKALEDMQDSIDPGNSDLWNNRDLDPLRGPAGIGPSFGASGEAAARVGTHYSDPARQPGTTDRATRIGARLEDAGFLGKAHASLKAVRAAIIKAEIATIEGNAVTKASALTAGATALEKAAAFLQKAAEEIEDSDADDTTDDGELEKALIRLRALASKLSMLKGGDPSGAGFVPASLPHSTSPAPFGSAPRAHRDPAAGAQQMRIMQADAGAAARALMGNMPVAKSGDTLPPDFSTRQPIMKSAVTRIAEADLGPQDSISAQRLHNAIEMAKAGRISDTALQSVIRSTSGEALRLFNISTEPGRFVSIH